MTLTKEQLRAIHARADWGSPEIYPHRNLTHEQVIRINDELIAEKMGKPRIKNSLLESKEKIKARENFYRQNRVRFP